MQILHGATGNVPDMFVPDIFMDTMSKMTQFRSGMPICSETAMSARA